MSAPLLEARGLVCRFGPKEAVKGLDLTLNAGDLVGLIGPDGAGKSTTFRMLVGLQRPTSGTIVRTLPDEQVAYVPQVFALAPDLTVMENMKLQAGLYGMKGAEARIHELLSRVDLDRFKDRMSGALSGGMKQKLALCVALLPSPRLLLLDEPTTGVDPVSRREFWALLHQIHDDGVAILFSSPYMDEAEYAFRILFMYDGHLLATGTPESFREAMPGVVLRVLTRKRRKVMANIEALNPLDLFGEGEQIRARFTPQDPAPLLDRIRALEGVEHVELSEATLEDTFLHALKEQDHATEATSQISGDVKSPAPAPPSDSHGGPRHG
ncbi:MAG: ABC transporter ATP-binding protein [Acidobacteria bacterium]|nr:ABC transporter ATP-binding protein [Acidobacteriota bacterium]